MRRRRALWLRRALRPCLQDAPPMRPRRTFPLTDSGGFAIFLSDLQSVYEVKHMKLNSRNRSTFLTFLGLGFLVGTLGWEVLERIVQRMGFELALGIGPVGFDLSVLSVFIKINPGTFIGILGGIFLFRVM